MDLILCCPFYVPWVRPAVSGVVSAVLPVPWSQRRGFEIRLLGLSFLRALVFRGRKRLGVCRSWCWYDVCRNGHESRRECQDKVRGSALDTLDCRFKVDGAGLVAHQQSHDTHAPTPDFSLRRFLLPSMGKSAERSSCDTLGLLWPQQDRQSGGGVLVMGQV